MTDDLEYPDDAVDLPVDVEHPVFPWLTERRRAYLYRVLAAVFLVLVGRGVVDGDAAGDLIALGAALLGTSTAAAHTTTRQEG